MLTNPRAHDGQTGHAGGSNSVISVRQWKKDWYPEETPTPLLPVTCPDLEAKSVSLNDLIAAEEGASSTTSRSKVLYTLTGITKPRGIRGKKISSPLKYRHTFQIESPSKPKKYKILSQKPLSERKFFTKKREIKRNDGIIQKYVPLLKNIRMLVDNILAADSSESYDEIREEKFKRNSPRTIERGDVVCTCERRSNTESTSNPQEKSAPPSTTVATEVQDEAVTTTVATTTPAFTTVDDNFRSIGRNKNVPVLSTRNSTSVWGDDNGLGTGSSSSVYGSFEGYIAGNNGNDERHTAQEAGTHTEDYEEHTDGYSRDDAGGDRSSERLRRIGIESGVTELSRGTGESEESALSRNETFKDVARELPEYEREIEHEIRRDETESPLSVPELDSGLRGNDAQEEVTIRTTEIGKESFSQNSASDKRVPDRNGPFTSEDQEVSAANEGIAPKHILPNSTYPVGKVVMIFDGYSVAKDVNGKNKLTEKAIQIHT